MTAAAIAGTFADFKLIRSRGVAQLVVEVPMEQADAALAALGGLPTTATDRWVAVARMRDKPVLGNPTTEQDRPLKGGELAKRAAILSQDRNFIRWARAHYDLPSGGWGENAGAKIIRDMCGVNSRADLDHNRAAAGRFLKIEQDFRNYQDFGPVEAQEGAYA